MEDIPEILNLNKPKMVSIKDEWNIQLFNHMGYRPP